MLYLAGCLSYQDMAILRAYAFKIDSHLTDRAFSKLPRVFPNEPIPTIHISRSRLQFLSGFKPVQYDCCINSCCCFVGPHKDCTQCPYCGEDRSADFSGKKRPRKVFNYLPLIPRLVTMYTNAEKAKEMRYRAFEHTHTSDTITDVFDSHIYRRLLGKKVVIDGKEMSYEYFSDPRDVALGLSTDGFGPFKRCTTTAWPLILFDYNLPPETRFHNKNIISLGVIPGPKKPKDMDSFLWPAFQEFMRLQLGVRAFDALADELFLLRAYLILVFGDIPAISMVMRMTGHNGYSPCRLCKILGVRVPNSRATTHYVPLNRSRHPGVRESGSGVVAYDPTALPLRTEAEILQQAQEVRDAPSKAQGGRLSKEYGIKGIPLLSYLKSLLFPQSFPYDFMHLIWENLIPNLILLWTGEYKGLDEGTEEYKLAPKVWEAICAAGATSGSTIPSVFGAHTPNLASNKSACSAEVWSFWTLYLGPVLLRQRFRQTRYYNHFLRLVKLLHMCLQFEITKDEVQIVREGFIKWVSDYEV